MVLLYPETKGAETTAGEMTSIKTHLPPLHKLTEYIRSIRTLLSVIFRKFQIPLSRKIKPHILQKPTLNKCMYSKQTYN